MQSNKFNIKFLGGCKVVGKVGISLESKSGKILLDYGVGFEDDKPVFPKHIRPKELKAILLTHAHLDHSGAIPLLYSGSYMPKTYMTEITYHFTLLLLEDFLKISKPYLPFEYREVEKLLTHTKTLRLNSELELDDIHVKLLNAGHIPGSVSFLIEAGDHRILYTGDFNLIETELLPPAEILNVLDKVDVLIMEATYANVDHPERSELERKFIEKLYEVMERGGIALIPAFAVGRSQEIICVLKKYNFEYPVIMDGMARKASSIILNNLNYVKNPKFTREALLSVTWVLEARQRSEILREPCVIVTPAGMLKGGAAVYYLKKLYNDPRNAIILVSYQIPGTPGRQLLDTGQITINGVEVKVKAEICWFDFSAHCGRTQLLNVLERLKPETKVFLIHGESPGLEELAVEAKKLNPEIQIYIPSEGEEYPID